MPFPLKWGESGGKRGGGGGGGGEKGEEEEAFHISSCKFSPSRPDYRRDGIDQALS